VIFRGEIWDAEIPGVGRHPVVIATGDIAIPLLTNLICVFVTPEYRGQVAEVEVGRGEYLSRTSAINCVNIFTLPKIKLIKTLTSCTWCVRSFQLSLRDRLGLGS
jgi:mRNA-degrading endonuclease toxin of MazEF toxin-antitoxin module